MSSVDDFTDETIYCLRCNEEFVWTAGEQAFYESKGLKPPKFCKTCRMERRDQNKGKVWGGRVAQYDTETRRVLCSQCSAPASKNLSRRSGRAICPKCAGQAGDLVLGDVLTIEEWARDPGSLKGVPT